jgi:threonine/homoserine/homoserine lactone efflux protein
MFAVALAKSYKSPWAGARISLGHAVIEVPLIFLIYLGVTEFFQSNPVRFGLSVAGSAMIFWLGVSMFRARAGAIEKGQDLLHSAFTAGIVTSAFNPFFLLWWVTIGSMLIMKFLVFGLLGLALFTVVHWLCDLVWLSFVSVLVYRTKSLWGRKFQEGLFIVCSLLLMGFGVWFLVSGIQLII